MAAPVDSAAALHAPPAERPHVVFDLGGTWFRCGVRRPDGVLEQVTRQPAVNYLSHPRLSQPELREGLVGYVLTQTQRLAPPASGRSPRVSISMGAALNGHTGVILNAGPLWGPDSQPFDLLGALAARRGDVTWFVTNDVTALATYFAHQPKYRKAAKISVLTVSTGIACRTIETATRTVPLHPLQGIQGEIGHVPVDFHAAGDPMRLRCDCGAVAHLNAYSSGRGIPQVMARLGHALGEPDWLDPALLHEPAVWARVLRRGLDERKPAARRLLDAVVRPLARSVISLLTVDPEVARIVVTGGVPRALGRHYPDAMLRNLTELGLYLISGDDPSYFADTVAFADSEADAGLQGAALAADVSVTGSPGGPPPHAPVLLAHRSRRMEEVRRTAYGVTVTDSGASNVLVDSLVAMGSGLHPVVVVDAAVAGTHGPVLVSALEQAGFRPVLKSVAAGEELKSWSSLAALLEVFESVGVSRKQHPVVAVGGGALLDAVGLAAGLYRRGVPYLRVPTSLVGLIDAGVGAKVAINAFGHKNRLGLFYPPTAVVLDVAFLQTLPHPYMVSGIAEAIKIAVVEDSDLYRLLEAHSGRLSDPGFYRTEHGVELVARAADSTMSSLAGNLWEADLERPLDFGHSVSPVIEVATRGGTTHGEAVAIDMALSLEIGRRRGVTAPRLADRVIDLIRRVGLPTHSGSVSAAQLFEHLGETAGHRGGDQRFPLIHRLGRHPEFVSDVTAGELAGAWSRLSSEWGPA
ncbi:ROK family protein [Streptomyces sp. NPDC005549]|uniref:ROK family protein n=1 Tax=Streptomyces sp. NPDC005549 TaxID=3154888 RepID=UPI0033AE7A0D